MAAKQKTSPDHLSCPNCGHQIAIGELMQHQVAERVRSEMAGQLAEAQQEITRREQQVVAERTQIDLAVASQVASAKREIEAMAVADAGRAVAAEKEATRQQLETLTRNLREAQATEVSLRKQTAQLEDRAAQLDVEVARRVDEARAEIGQQVATRVETDHRLALADRDRQLAMLTDTVAVLQSKLEQGSQQAQGETLELEIEKMLRATFALDSIEPVPKGVQGADVVHRVVSRSGLACGAIIWEVKRTKTFNEDWIAKLRADQRVARCEVAVLVTATMPEGVRYFCHMDGVWVCSVECAEVLAVALRHQIVEVSQSVAINYGKKNKQEVVYEYLAGQGFRQRIEAIVEAFTEMEADIAEERRVSERRWAKREKQVRQVVASTAGMYGDLQGMIGSSLEQIKLLEAK